MNPSRDEKFSSALRACSLKSSQAYVSGGKESKRWLLLYTLNEALQEWVHIIMVYGNTILNKICSLFH